MAPAVAEQALWFVWALGMGAGLALLYDFLRELRRLCPRATESFSAGISLVLESNWKNMEDNLVAAWCSVEKNQKILKISLFNWAQMG